MHRVSGAPPLDRIVDERVAPTALLGWLADGLNQLIFCVDVSSSRLLYLSDGSEAIWGRSREALLAYPHSWRDAVLTQDRLRIDAIMRATHLEGECYQVEYRVRHPDGSMHRVCERGARVHDGDDATSKIIGHAIDVTDQRPRSDDSIPTDDAWRAPTGLAALDHGGTRIRVVVAEARPLIRRGLTSMLCRHEVCISAEVESSADALAAWKRHRPDVLLLDQDLPSSGALPLLREIRQCDPSARVIILGRNDQESGISAGLRSGARAFLSATTSEADVLQCIRLVHGGQTFVSQSVAMLITAHMSCDPLTTRELEILSLVADGRSNKRIARTLEIAENTVKSHVHKILGKTATNSRTEAVAMALRRGLVAPPA